MSFPDENSIHCKDKNCSIYNIDEPYCVDCAIDELQKAGINKNTIEKVIRILYGDREWKFSWRAKKLKNLTIKYYEKKEMDN